ncbi:MULTISPECIES: helix-turn-helix domain-containing protein [unclassified Thioalkalivibrio]|uniref:AlbA family DNA-binding domain-containing protein n=1 Tax=unclassified Thioalkalivibrio TaxID=2621013 RepID=UPI00036D8242|nr:MULTISPECIES: ATP-binding protein [unclassified Thioalkalivibrio]
MHELFNKPLAELRPEDIDALPQRGEPESQYLEFKEEPPGKADTWQKAALDLAGEVVAFANADGGVLVLGIKDEGNQATGVVPIPEAEKVADSLRRSFTSTIDPYPVGLEVGPVPYNDDGGVIVARVPASPEAPHGVKDKQRFRVTVRRGEEAKPLDMRDIQLHTLETRRRADDAEQRLEARRAAFQALIPPAYRGGDEPPGVGFRITVTPARAVYRVPSLKQNATRLFQHKQGVPPLEWTIHMEEGSTKTVSTGFHYALVKQRPFLRGVRARTDDAPNGSVTFTAFEDGTVDLAVMDVPQAPLAALSVIGEFLGVAEVAVDLREQAGAGRAELMIDVEFATANPAGSDAGSQHVGRSLEFNPRSALNIGRSPPEIRTPVRFPRYMLVEAEDLTRVAAEFWRDVCDVAGVTGMPSITAVERR